MGKYVEELVMNKLQEIKSRSNEYEVGRVVSVREYILEVSGLENAAFYERVQVSGKSEGYVIGIRRNSVMVALVKKNSDIYVGDEVIATGKEFCLSYDEEAFGHIVNMMGEDVMTGKMLEHTELMHIENPTTPIMDRTSVNRPLETGLAGIDLIYPIGRGQRQLIIGDKKTGKTQIALDTILNQKDKDVLCIYIAIGKTKKALKEVYAELQKKGAMKYTLILAALNDDLPPILSLTPYAGLAIAEKYMHQGKDVLVVIDDLSRHADCYREISLLIGKVPAVTHIRQIFSTPIPECWKRDVSISAAVPSRSCPSWRPEEEISQTTSPPTSSPSQTDRSYCPRRTLTVVRSRLSTMAYPYPVWVVPYRPVP